MGKKKKITLNEASYLRGKEEATDYLGKTDKASIREWMPHHLRMINENIAKARGEGDEWTARNLEGWLEVLNGH